MKVLRLAVLIPAFALVAPAAFARMEGGAFDPVIARPAPRVEAMRAALDAIAEPSDTIEKAALDGVRAFYDAHGDDVVWLASTQTEANARALRAIMDDAGSYGLTSDAYATPEFSHNMGDDPQSLAARDLDLTRALARFAVHISSGRVEPEAVSPDITLHPERPDVAAALDKLLVADDVGAVLASLEPPNPQYAALKAALKTLRAEAAAEKERVVVPEGRLLKPGSRDERVPILRARLDVAPPAPVEDAEEADADAAATDATEVPSDDVYDDTLVEAVKAFQAEHGLNTDGIVGPQTLLTLNGRSSAEAIASVAANMERWRWMPRDLGEFHVFVNVPEFMVHVVDHGAIVHETRVVVGKPENRTPIFSHEMSHLIVNPYWNVPLSILTKEMMPEVQADPSYFGRHGYEVFVRLNGKFRQVDPRWVDWYGINPRVVHIRQVPGERNALGRIKFMFPNQHAVYLHDTPSKSLFSRDRRAFSHGCVRVENPLDFADAVLAHGAPEWNSKRLQKLFGGAERRVNLDTQIPVHLAYFTDWVGDDGKLRHFGDIYGYDAAMQDNSIGY